MGRPPNYEELYKVALVLLKVNSANLSTFPVSEYSHRVGCNKRTMYNHIQRIQRDMVVI